ncbi:MAG: SOS response-associated peptidase [bacterium]
MCGRFSLSAPPEAVAEFFRLVKVPPLPPRYNIAPTTPVAVVRAAEQGASGRELALLRWGLVPSWAKDLAFGNRLINARAETVAQKPSFRAAIRARRCLVPASGYYEWRTEGEGKQPYHIRRADGAPLAFAGLWETWQNPEHGTVETCTIITTEAAGAPAEIHHRMPVMLNPADFDAWLDPEQTQAEPVIPLLQPKVTEGLEVYAVSRQVNRATFDEPACIEPLD